MKIIRIIIFLSVFQIAWAEDGDDANGKQLYYDFGCYGCHGYNATMRVPLLGDASGIMSNEGLFVSYLRLRADQNPINPKNAMPNYSAETLSDEQAKKIYAYIRSIDDDSPDVVDNVVMQQILEAAKQRNGNE